MLFRLREKHQHAWPFVGLNRVNLFLRVGNGEAIAGFVIRGLPIYEEHVVMRPITLDVMQGDVPGIEHAVADERNFLPMIE